MLSLARIGSVCLVTLLTVGAVGCAAEEETVEDAAQDVTGGQASVEPPTVYFFDTGSQVKCVGALLDADVAVTAKSCAKVGLTVVRPGTNRNTEATVTEVSVPSEKDAEIAVVRLSRNMPGPFAVVTQAPLRDGYTVNSIDSSSERNRISSIEAQMVSETDTQGAMVGKNGAQICTTDIGAPVCSSVLGTCGLAGLIVGAPDADDAPKVENGGTTAPNEPGTEVQRTCPSGAWKVAQLGRHAVFLAQAAPKAFQPVELERTVFGNIVIGTEKVAPEGLWGFKSAGTVRTCKIETPKLDPAKVSTETKVSAKVSFSNMQQRATAWGRFGIAPKSAPTAVRWLPATAQTNPRGSAFDVTFEGAVGADKDGDFIVSFRTSANGGESWTQCDLDGIENGFSADKALALKVGDGDKPGETKPQDAPASPTSSDKADSRPDPDDDSTIGEGNDDGSGDDVPGDDPAPKKKKKANAGGCSAAPASAPDTSLAFFGIAAVLGGLVRRRKR